MPHTRGMKGEREKGIEQAARARCQTEDSASSSDGSIPTVFVWRFACHRVAACPLYLAQPPPLTPQLLPPHSANPNPANSFAVAVDACFIYCFFNPFLVDLLSLSFLLVRCSALPPFFPFCSRQHQCPLVAHHAPTARCIPFPPSTFPASSSFGDWQVSLLRAAIQRSLNELDSIRNASILRWPRKFLPFRPLTPYPLHPT